MSESVEISVNGRALRVAMGSRVEDALVAAGLRLDGEEEGTRRVEVVSGTLDDAGTRIGRAVLAPEARITGPVALDYAPGPLAISAGGDVVSLRELGGEMVEVTVAVNKPVPYLPGQHVRLAFQGFPERAYSPTLTLDGLRELDQLVFHIRRLAGGAVGGALGSAIRPGHRVKLKGPFGRSFLRRGEGRLILVSSAAGFAPIWSIAVAARLGQPHRPLHLVASARDPRNLYMRPAIDWLATHGVNTVLLTASGAIPLPPNRHGRATAHLPTFWPEDTVHAAGAPDMVAAIGQRATAAGAGFFGEAFQPAEAEAPLARRIGRMLGMSEGRRAQG